MTLNHITVHDGRVASGQFSRNTVLGLDIRELGIVHFTHHNIVAILL